LQNPVFGKIHHDADCSGLRVFDEETTLPIGEGPDEKGKSKRLQFLLLEALKLRLKSTIKEFSSGSAADCLSYYDGNYFRD
jgi:hypothetical protein